MPCSSGEIARGSLGEQRLLSATGRIRRGEPVVVGSLPTTPSALPQTFLASVRRAFRLATEKDRPAANCVRHQICSYEKTAP